MRRRHRLAALLAMLLVAGCGSLAPVPDEAREVAGLLANHERLATSKIDEQRREFNAALAAHERTTNDTTRLGLALALMLPRAPWRDDARALALLAGVEAAPGAQRSARHDLAQLLLRQLAERQRVQREEQRKADVLAQQLREERQKSEELQQKIESLRRIDRESTLRKRPQ